MTGDTTTTTNQAIESLLSSTRSLSDQLIATIRRAQHSGPAHTEAALIRAHAALEDALRHLHEAEAPFAEVSYEGQAITPVRVQDIEDPDKP